jgi:sarcosine oxidase subunit alpha
MSAASSTGRLEGADYGSFVDRRKPLSFTFDGRLYSGYEGDVIASALYAQGRVLVSRSFKYHRPRGVLTMSGQDVNTFVQVGGEPNARADQHLITDGLAVKSINRLGPLDHDLLASIGLISRFLPVGFYYKTFYWPRGVWQHVFERPIRAMAGLGTLEPEAPHKYYDKAYLFADVLVIGGGPAGIEAAIAAAEAGADTLLLEQLPQLGGSLLYARSGGDRAAVNARCSALIERARATPKLRIMTDTTATGMFADNWTSAVRGNRFFKIRSKETVIATGVFDQPLVFANNDRPGIMFADAAQRLMRLYGVKPGKRAVIVTANRYGYEAALDLLDAGVSVAAIVDLNFETDSPALEELRARDVRIMPGATLVDSKGRKRVSSVAVATIGSDGLPGTLREWIDCDLVLMSVGFSPALNLASHAGAKVVFDPQINMHRAIDLPPGLSLVGAAAGVWSHAAVIGDSRHAGAAAAARAGHGDCAPRSAPVVDATAAQISHPYPVFADPHGHDFIDFDEDLKTNDIVNSVKDGYDDIQLVKRYSTVGLGSSQGRHSNLNTIRIVAKQTGKSIESIGTTTFRPPFVPEKFAALAGRGFEPVRHTAMHQRHIELGAQMMPAGLWMRPAYYGKKAESQRAIEREVRAVRQGVGMIDVSTLGGLDVRGPDAAAFIDRMYTWAYEKQPIGRARYTLMTDLTGVVIDDGVAARLHERHYYVTATTGAVDQVYRQMTWFNVQWKMDVDVANVTAAYAGINLAGPQARAVIEKLDSDIDFSATAFPYMAARVGQLAGIPVRVLRVGFVGELGYEIHVPAGLGEALWDRLMEAGKGFGMAPFGVEAQRILRLEKGHIIVGQDTDGLTNPAEANMEWALAKKKAFYVGKRAVDMQIAKGLTRKLAGFALIDPAAPLPKECHLIIRDGDIAGRVTSVTRSPTLGKVVGLAYVPPDLAEPGKRFEIRVDGGRMVTAETVPVPFYDPDNKRQDM